MTQRQSPFSLMMGCLLQNVLQPLLFVVERTKPIISSTLPPKKMETDSDPHFSAVSKYLKKLGLRCNRYMFELREWRILYKQTE